MIEIIRHINSRPLPGCETVTSATRASEAYATFPTIKSLPFKVAVTADHSPAGGTTYHNMARRTFCIAVLAGMLPDSKLVDLKPLAALLDRMAEKPARSHDLDSNVGRMYLLWCTLDPDVANADRLEAGAFRWRDIAHLGNSDAEHLLQAAFLANKANEEREAASKAKLAKRTRRTKRTPRAKKK